MLVWNCLTYKNQAMPPSYINGGYMANGYMANSQCIHFSAHIALNQIWLAGKVSWNPIWHPQGHRFGHISLNPKWIWNEPKAACRSVGLRSCLCSAQRKLLPEALKSTAMTALEVGWLIFHVLSYLTTVLVPDFGNLNSKWVCGCSQPFWIWPLTCNNLFQQKKNKNKIKYWGKETAVLRLSLWDGYKHPEQCTARTWRVLV